MENSIEEDIKIALDKFSDNKDIDSAILIVEKFILGNYILRGGRKNIVKDSLRYILSDYKKLQEEFREVDHECDRLEKIDFEKDIKVKELQKENEKLKKDYYNVINKIENKIDRFDYEFEKAKRQNNKDKSDYYWDLIINFSKLLESEE